MIEHIGLILIYIFPLAQTIHPSVKINTCIMSRRNMGRAQLRRLMQQPFKFNIPIARNTRIWCASEQILIQKIVDHRRLERHRKVHHIMPNPQNIRHASRIIHTAERTAAAVVFRIHIAVLIGKTHRNPDDIIALCKEQRRRKRTIHTAAHRDDNTLFPHYPLH